MNKRGWRLISILLALVLLCTGCAPLPSGSAGDKAPVAPYTAVDKRGQQVSLTAPPQAVIALTPSDVEILFALGLEEEILAVGEFCDYPAAAEQKPKLGSGQNTSIEQIIALEPDLVLLSWESAAPAYAQQLKEVGIPVFFTNPQDLTQTYETIGSLGALVGKEEEAAAIVAGMQDRIAALTAERDARQLPAAKVYIEASPLSYGLWTCGRQTFQDEALALIGAENIFGDIQSWQPVNEEEVISRNPQVIISSASDYGIPDPVAEIRERPNWQGVEAVRTGRVYLIEDDILTRPTPRLAEGIEELYRLVYPEEKD